MKINNKYIIFCFSFSLIACEKSTGFLTVLTGPMYSGKTASLIQFIRTARSIGQEVGVFSHGFDQRSEYELSSRQYPEEHIFAIKTTEPYEIMQHFLKNSYRYIAIDEIQFFSTKLAQYIKIMLDMNAIVCVSGLDLNFRNEPFSDIMGKLCQMADQIVKLTARCSVCGKAATSTQRLVDNRPARINDELILLDNGLSVVKYEPRCRNCHKLS